MRGSRRSCFLLCYCLLTIGLLGCSSSPVASPAPSSTLSVPLTHLDWANFTYFSSCYGNTQPFKTKNGVAHNDHITFEVFRPVFGDLTGDGQPEAAVPYQCFAADSGGMYVFVYTGDATHPHLLGQLPLAQTSGSETVFNTLMVQISDQQIELTGTSYSPDAPRCCPDRSLSLWYRWNGSQFVTVRETEKPLA